MKLIKTSMAYVLRKKTRTLIIFIILTLVLSCLYACLNIMKSGDSLEKSLYKTSNSSLSVMKKDGQGNFEKKEFKAAYGLREIKEVIPQYDGVARLVNGNVVSSKQKIKREHVPDSLKNVVSIQATNNTKRNVLFNSGVFKIKEGRNLGKNDVDKIIVHSDFAKRNKLKLNDEISLRFVDPAKKDSSFKEHKFKIVGIFTGKKQEKYTGLSSDLSENMMFADYGSVQKALNRSEGKEIVNKLTLFTDTPEKMDGAIKKVKALNVNWSKYKVDKDTKAFKNALDSLNGIKHIIKIMTYAIMAGGAIVLSLILILWLRERIYEIGILLSIGVSKIKIVTQFILELVFVSIPSLAVSLVFGNFILKRFIGGFGNSGEVGSIAPTAFVKGGYNFDNIVTFTQSYGILMVIIFLSVIFASSMILIKKPKEILSKIS